MAFNLGLALLDELVVDNYQFINLTYYGFEEEVEDDDEIPTNDDDNFEIYENSSN